MQQQFKTNPRPNQQPHDASAGVYYLLEELLWVDGTKPSKPAHWNHQMSRWIGRGEVQEEEEEEVSGLEAAADFLERYGGRWTYVEGEAVSGQEGLVFAWEEKDEGKIRTRDHEDSEFTYQLVVLVMLGSDGGLSTTIRDALKAAYDSQSISDWVDCDTTEEELGDGAMTSEDLEDLFNPEDG